MPATGDPAGRRSAFATSATPRTKRSAPTCSPNAGSRSITHVPLCCTPTTMASSSSCAATSTSTAGCARRPATWSRSAPWPPPATCAALSRLTAASWLSRASASQRGAAGAQGRSGITPGVASSRRSARVRSGYPHRCGASCLWRDAAHRAARALGPRQAKHRDPTAPGRTARIASKRCPDQQLQALRYRPRATCSRSCQVRSMT